MHDTPAVYRVPGTYLAHILLLVFSAHFLRARGDWARYSNIMHVCNINNKDMMRCTYSPYSAYSAYNAYSA